MRLGYGWLDWDQKYWLDWVGHEGKHWTGSGGKEKINHEMVAIEGSVDLCSLLILVSPQHANTRRSDSVA